MYGMGDSFEYFECPGCRTLQIKDVPEDLSGYYGSGYYSFQNVPNLFDNRFKAFLKKNRARAGTGEKGFLKKLLAFFYRPPEYFEWLKKTKVHLESSILDVGCGSGHLLISMKKDGFLHLRGLEKFIEDDVAYGNGVIIYKGALDGILERFDLIMLHHSFEHMPDPLKELKHLYRLLKNDSFALIRVPVFGTFAWKEYGPDWIQIDAPRHLFLYSVKSMEYLAEKSGFKLVEVVFDSTEFQFWGSEQCRRGINLWDENSVAKNPKNGIFSPRQIRAFKKRARVLNQNKDGDQACFYLYKD